VDKNQTTEELQKEIELLKLQLQSKKKELSKFLNKTPSGIQKGGSWLLKNKNDWGKIFEIFEREGLKNINNRHQKRLTKKSNLKGFTESCEEVGYSGVLLSNIRNINSHQLQKLKVEFIKRYEKSVEKILKIKDEELVEKDKEDMNLFKEELIKSKGEFKKVVSKFRNKYRLFNKYPHFREEVESLRIKIRDENWEIFCKECIDRYNHFIELEIQIDDCLELSGIGRIKSKEGIDFLKDNKVFSDSYIKEREILLKESYDSTLKDWNHVKKQKDYIEKLTDIKLNFKIKKEWDTGTNRKQWNLKQNHFIKPDYKRIFYERIDKIINLQQTKLKDIKKRVQHNEKLGLLQRKEQLKIEKERVKYIREHKELKKSYKFRTSKDILSDTNFFDDLERIVERRKVFHLTKEVMEELNVGGYVINRLRRIEPDFNQKIDDIFQKILKENMIRTLEKLPDKLSDIITRISKNGKVFYDVNNKVVVKYCDSCGEFKSKKHFVKSVNITSICLECLNRKSGSRRRGEMMNGKIIKKYNSMGDITHRRCTSCDEFKEGRKFSHRWKGSSVCDDCYVELPNNLLTRKGEYNSKGIQLRRYNSNYIVTHKRCSSCEIMKDISGFNNYVNSKIDGKSWTCKECSIKYTRERRMKQKNHS
jgi:hypothetical protein